MYAQDTQTVLGDALLIVIMLSLLIIAATFWLRLRIKGDASLLMPRVVIAGLVVIAFTGYFPRLLPVDATLLLLLHLLLAVLSWWYTVYALLDLAEARREASRSGDRPGS